MSHSQLSQSRMSSDTLPEWSSSVIVSGIVLNVMDVVPAPPASPIDSLLLGRKPQLCMIILSRGSCI